MSMSPARLTEEYKEILTVARIIMHESDPNGYVVELAARIRPPIYDEPPREILARWTSARAASA